MWCGVQMDAKFHQYYTIAYQCHANQTDRAGRPYMEHVMDVVGRCSTEEGRLLALIHDVGEHLIKNGEFHQLRFWQRYLGDNDPKLGLAFDLITKRPDETYREYIEALATNELAKEVKVADLQSNMSPDRAFGLLGTSLPERYINALFFLQNGKWMENKR